MSKFKTMPGDLEIVRGGTLLEKYNPNHGADSAAELVDESGRNRTGRRRHPACTKL